MNRDVRVHIEDILGSMEKIEGYMEDLSLEDLEGDPKTFEAIVWNFTVPGEATRGIPDEIRSRYPDVPWREMAGMRMRDKLVHQYSEIDIGIVWQAVRKRFPDMKPRLRTLLDDLGGTA